MREMIEMMDMMIRATMREIRMIVVVDRELTMKKSWVWIDPTWLEASIVTSMKSEGIEGIPEIFPVVASNINPWGRDPEVMLNESWSPDMIGAVEK